MAIRFDFARSERLLLLGVALAAVPRPASAEGHVHLDVTPLLLTGSDGKVGAGGQLDLGASYVFKRGFELGVLFRGEVYSFADKTMWVYRPKLLLGWSGRGGAVGATLGYDNFELVPHPTNYEEYYFGRGGWIPLGVRARIGRLDGAHALLSADYPVLPPFILPTVVWLRVNIPVGLSVRLSPEVHWDYKPMQIQGSFGFERYLAGTGGPGTHVLRVAIGMRGSLQGSFPLGPLVTMGYEYRY